MIMIIMIITFINIVMPGFHQTWACSSPFALNIGRILSCSSPVSLHRRSKSDRLRLMRWMVTVDFGGMNKSNQ